MNNMKVYYSRAVDGLPRHTVEDEMSEAVSMLRECGLDVINRFDLDAEDMNEMVRGQIGLVGDCDILVADMSIPDHKYIGCVGEVVYAQLYGKTVYVISGDSGNDCRPWLIYHTTRFFRSMRDLCGFLCGGGEEGLG